MMSKNWCFTLNNYTADDEALLAAAPVQYMVYGHEVASTGTEHLQGFLVLEKTARISGLKKLHPRCHWEAAKGSAEQNKKYCTKEARDIVERGTPPKTKEAIGADEKARWAAAFRSAKAGLVDDVPEDIRLRYYSTIKKIAGDFQVAPAGLEGELQNEWIYGPAGSGKSTRAHAENPGAYLKAVNKWWDGYVDQATVIVEDMDPFHKSLALEFKLWGQHQPFPAESKGCTAAIRPKKIVVTSNYSIDEVWEDSTTREAMHRRYREIYHGTDSSSSTPPPPASPFPYCDMQCNPKKRKSP